MTPSLVKRIYERPVNGGFKAAYAAAVASGEERLVKEVFLISLQATGIAWPHEITVIRKAAGQSLPKCTVEVREKMPMDAVAELRVELERRKNRPPREVQQNSRQPREEDEETSAFKQQFSSRFPGPASISAGRLNAAEVARRQAALAAAGVVRA